MAAIAVVVNAKASITSSRTVVAAAAAAEDAAAAADDPATIQHFLCFFPEPQGHFSLGFVFFGGMIDSIRCFPVCDAREL